MPCTTWGLSSGKTSLMRHSKVRPNKGGLAFIVTITCEQSNSHYLNNIVYNTFFSCFHFSVIIKSCMSLTQVLFFYFLCADDRFPEYGKVEFIFSFGPEKINGESLQLTCAGEHIYVAPFD